MEPDTRPQGIPADLAERYCANELSLHDRIVLEACFKANPECRNEMESLKALLGMKNLPPLGHIQKRDFADAILAGESVADKYSTTSSKRRYAPWVAAAFVCVLAVFTATSALNHSQRGDLGVARSAGYTTGMGQRAKVSLSDGSEALLNAGTLLRFHEYDNGTREIELKGEALFTVVSSQSKPFIVRTGGVATRVLGTSFSVRNYDTDSSVRVTVATGKVEFDKAVLTTGDMGVYSGGRVSVSRNTNISSALAWTDGELVFASSPLRAVIPELERWYGIKVAVTDTSLLDEPVTTSLKTESVLEVLSLLGSALDASYMRTGSQVTFAPRKSR